MKPSSQDNSTPGWPENFPNVTQLSTIVKLRSMKDFAAAKGGDREAAARLIPALLQGDAQQAKLRRLRDLYPNAILVPVHAEERGGENFIPSTLADYIGSITGLDVDEEIVQSAKVGRTGQDGWFRLAFRPKFDGNVQAGRDYILVDDIVTGGGTFGELRRHIERHGGRVVDAVTAGAAQFSQRLALTVKTKLALEQKFGVQSLQTFLQEHELYGGNHTALTESEARILLGARSLDAARNRILAAIEEERRRSRAGSVQESAEAGLIPSQQSLPFDPVELEQFNAGGECRQQLKQNVFAAGNKALDRNYFTTRNLVDAVNEYGTISSIISGLVDGERNSAVLHGLTVRTPRDLAAGLGWLRDPYQERFGVALLDKNNRVLNAQILTVGVLNEVSISGQVIARAIQQSGGKAHKYIVFHNHPSGNPSPSAADIMLTEKISRMKMPYGAEFGGHIITNGDSYASWDVRSRSFFTDRLFKRNDVAWELVPREKLPDGLSTGDFSEMANLFRATNKDNALVMYLSSQHQLVGVESVPPTKFKGDRLRGNAEYLNLRATEEGAAMLFVDAPGMSPAMVHLLNNTLTVKILDASDVTSGKPETFYAQGLMETPVSQTWQSVGETHADSDPTQTESTTAQSIVDAIIKRSIQNAKNFSPAQLQTKSAVK